jgi:hypothetical protein
MGNCCCLAGGGKSKKKAIVGAAGGGGKCKKGGKKASATKNRCQLRDGTAAANYFKYGDDEYDNDLYNEDLASEFDRQTTRSNLSNLNKSKSSLNEKKLQHQRNQLLMSNHVNYVNQKSQLLHCGNANPFYNLDAKPMMTTTTTTTMNSKATPTALSSSGNFVHLQQSHLNSNYLKQSANLANDTNNHRDNKTAAAATASNNNKYQLHDLNQRGGVIDNNNINNNSSSNKLTSNELSNANKGKFWNLVVVG